MPTFPERLQKLDDNERRLLHLLRYEGVVTRLMLQERMGLSSSSMHRLTGGLQKAGLIEQLGEGQSAGGRKPVLFGIGNRTGLLAGVELSRTEVRMLLCRPDLTAVERMRFSLDAGYGPDETVNAITAHLRAAMSRQGATPGDIPGIGLGTVGVLNRKAGEILKTTGFTHDGWQQVPISRMLAQRLGISVHLDNGANLAVLAERLAGCGRGHGTIAYIHLGMGIRTGIFSRGEILRHFGEPLDAFGHMSVEHNGRLCACGNRGCLETFATFPSLSGLLNIPDDSGGDDIQTYLERLDGEVSDAEASDAALRVEQAARVFGTGLANLVRMTSAGVVILSGPVVRRSRRFFETATGEARHQLQGFVDPPVHFERDGHFGEWAIATGAAAYVFDLSCTAIKQGNEEEETVACFI